MKQKECEDLIFKEIKKYIEKPNYYQIKSFIDILATEFKKFSQKFFIAYLLKENNIKNKIRPFIDKSLIKITNHFTKGAFTEIVKSQQKTYDTLFGQYDEVKDIEKVNEDLSNCNHEIVSL